MAFYANSKIGIPDALMFIPFWNLLSIKYPGIKWQNAFHPMP
jgi:hypothetical protein